MRVLYKEYPELWAKLKEWDKKTWRNFKADYSVEGLEARFDFEDKWQQQGKETKGKEFHAALKEYMEEQKCLKK
jgi:hypothetical protein